MIKKIKNMSVNSTTACAEERVKTIKTFGVGLPGDHKSNDILSNSEEILFSIPLLAELEIIMVGSAARFLPSLSCREPQN
jgi:hypothetical protein